jgi:three-Cys-motif partner protein
MKSGQNLPRPLWDGTIDQEGEGSKGRSIADRDTLLNLEASHPTSAVYRETQPYALEKLRDIRSYLWSYSVILNKNVPGHFALVDGFSGPGIVDLRGALLGGQRRLDSGPSVGDLALGSPFLALTNRPHFPAVYLLEKDPLTLEALKVRTDAYYPGRAHVECEDANSRLPDLARELGESNTPTLFILDPEGLELWMSTIYGIAKNCPKAEILVLYPSYMAVARCYKRQDIWPTLDRFFGDDFRADPDEGWRLQVEFTRALIDKEDYLPDAVHEKLFRYYQSQVESAGFQYVVPSSVIKTGQNRPLYHLLFAGNNQTGGKIIADIFKPRRFPPRPQKETRPTFFHQESGPSGVSELHPTV